MFHSLCSLYYPSIFLIFFCYLPTIPHLYTPLTRLAFVVIYPLDLRLDFPFHSLLATANFFLLFFPFLSFFNDVDDVDMNGLMRTVLSV